jgi:hypothetical protein
MATAFWGSRLLYVAAKLRIADLLADGPRTAEELAARTRTHAPSLHRVLRTLASLGIFAHEGRAFALTPLGAALKTGSPGAARATIVTLASDWMWRTWEHILHSLQTGAPAFDQAFGEPIFDWLGKHPEEASLFSETMVGFHGQEPAAIAAAYDFSGAKTIVDVGGATGNLLAGILAAHRGPHGVLFDLPHVVADARNAIESAGLAARITVEAGSFFERVPAGGDLYLLSHVIHDWSEQQCLTILANCRRVLKPDGRVLVIEMVLPDDDSLHPGKMLDIMMLVGPGGRERTASEYEALLAKAGLRLVRVVPTQSAVSVVEATPL